MIKLGGTEGCKPHSNEGCNALHNKSRLHCVCLSSCPFSHLKMELENNLHNVLMCLLGQSLQEGDVKVA